MTPEQDLWKELKKFIPGHATRIENAMGFGIPDVHLCHRGNDYWIELKIDHGHGCLIRSSQKIWHHRRHREGGISYVLCWHKKHEFYSLFSSPFITEERSEHHQIISEPIFVGSETGELIDFILS